MASQSVKQLVDGKIAGKRVMVFSKSYCPFCKKAKKALAEYNLSDDDYEIMEIENNPDCAAIQQYLRKLTGAQSVPRVFINGKCIGGGDETAQLKSNGKLDQLLGIQKNTAKK